MTAFCLFVFVGWTHHFSLWLDCEFLVIFCLIIYSANITYFFFLLGIWVHRQSIVHLQCVLCLFNFHKYLWITITVYYFKVFLLINHMHWRDFFFHQEKKRNLLFVRECIAVQCLEGMDFRRDKPSFETSFLWIGWLSISTTPQFHLL